MAPSGVYLPPPQEKMSFKPLEEGAPEPATAYRCPQCSTFVIDSGADETRDEMVARWKNLTGESPKG
jgi:hypothetical protein